jgi:hypothetical protein
MDRIRHFGMHEPALSAALQSGASKARRDESRSTNPCVERRDVLLNAECFDPHNYIITNRAVSWAHKGSSRVA